jgi:hypothetical protein
MTDKAAWQDISTAPKDGTEIILGWAVDVDCAGAVAVGYWMGNPERNFWRETGWFTSDEDVLCHHPICPTHWQALPSPPESVPANDELSRLRAELAMSSQQYDHLEGVSNIQVETINQLRERLDRAEGAFNTAFQATKWKMMNALTQEECDLWTKAWELMNSRAALEGVSE